MGSLISGSKSRGPSQQQLALQREQAELAKKQQAQIAEQKERLIQQEEAATTQAEAARKKRITDQRAVRSRARGRRSLIASGSELGTDGQLG